MADDVKIDLQDNSPYRVALDLAYRIAHVEKHGDDPRAYYLKLYSQCIRVVKGGWKADDALRDDDDD